MLRTFDFWYLLINFLISHISTNILDYTGGFSVFAISVNNLNWILIVLLSNISIMLNKCLRQVVIGLWILGYTTWLLYFHFSRIEEGNEQPIVSFYPNITLGHLARVSCTNVIIFLFKVFYLNRRDGRVVFSNIFLNIEPVHTEEKERYGMINVTD